MILSEIMFDKTLFLEDTGKKGLTKGHFLLRKMRDV